MPLLGKHPAVFSSFGSRIFLFSSLLCLLPCRVCGGGLQLCNLPSTSQLLQDTVLLPNNWYSRQRRTGNLRAAAGCHSQGRQLRILACRRACKLHLEDTKQTSNLLVCSLKADTPPMKGTMACNHHMFWIPQSNRPHPRRRVLYKGALSGKESHSLSSAGQEHSSLKVCPQFAHVRHARLHAVTLPPLLRLPGRRMAHANLHMCALIHRARTGL